jgi:hypothetical protein
MRSKSGWLLQPRAPIHASLKKCCTYEELFRQSAANRIEDANYLGRRSKSKHVGGSDREETNRISVRLSNPAASCGGLGTTVAPWPWSGLSIGGVEARLSQLNNERPKSFTPVLQALCLG